MSRDCYGIEELGDLLEAGAQDPRHAHVRRCVRCRNTLGRLREFRAPTRDVPEGDLQRAVQQMTAALEQAQAPGAAASGAGHSRERLSTPGRAWFDWMRGAWWRPALGAAVLMVAVIAALNLPDRPRDTGDRVVRGPAAGLEPVLALEPPTTMPTGQLRLAWRELEGADAYQVVLYNLSLDELASFPAGSATGITLEPSVLRSAAPAGEEVLWKVIATRRGADYASSPVASLVIP